MFDLLIFIFHSLYDCTHNGDEPPKDSLTKFCKYELDYSFLRLIFINVSFHTSLIQQSLHAFVIAVNNFCSRCNTRVANCPLLKILLINSAEPVILDNGREPQVYVLGLLSYTILLNCCLDVHVSSNI